MRNKTQFLIGCFLLVSTGAMYASEFTVPPQTINTPTTNTIAIDKLTQPHVENETVQWDKTPIPVVIPTGQERLVSFAGRVELINTDTQLTTDKIRIMNNNGTLYLKAFQSFSPIRVAVKQIASGETVLLDLSSQPNADDIPLTVLINTPDLTTATSSSVATTTDYPINTISLLRFAIQQLYAPLRVAVQTDSITRLPLYSTKTVALFRGGNTLAFPLITWQGGNDTVTAVLVKNSLMHSITLDPRAINGRWTAVAFYPRNRLRARGLRGDATTVFLIADQPFALALGAMADTREQR